MARALRIVVDSCRIFLELSRFCHATHFQLGYKCWSCSYKCNIEAAIAVRTKGGSLTCFANNTPQPAISPVSNTGNEL